jgi:hypothetical protein
MACRKFEDAEAEAVKAQMQFKHEMSRANGIVTSTYFHLYRPEFLRRRVEAYAASAAIGSRLCRTAFRLWKPCRAISQVEL